ncbi:hypothetical protein HDE_11734 [Halotydeus destructor]|nr:hypothetical protein HDE_11734 [Halotydeus destructor]
MSYVTLVSSMIHTYANGIILFQHFPVFIPMASAMTPGSRMVHIDPYTNMDYLDVDLTGGPFAHHKEREEPFYASIVDRYTRFSEQVKAKELARKANQQSQSESQLVDEQFDANQLDATDRRLVDVDRRFTKLDNLFRDN